MTYDQWLELLKRLERTSHQEDINLFKNEPYNDNINPLLAPKIKNMLIDKFNRYINYMISDLETIFSDENELDLALVTLKKNVKVIIDLIENNQLNPEQKKEIKDKIKDGCDGIYKSLYNAAFEASDDGVYNSIIKRNRIKWSDENELPGN